MLMNVTDSTLMHGQRLKERSVSSKINAML